MKREKKGVLDHDPPRKPDSSPCKRKAVSERDSCVCILKMRAEAMHKRMGQSARADCVVGAKYHSQFLIVIGKAFVAHVNARSSNHDPNHVLNHVPKRLSERDSSPCKHTHYLRYEEAENIHYINSLTVISVCTMYICKDKTLVQVK